MSSEAPTRLKTASTIPIVALVAGTKLPACARITINAFCRRNVLWQRSAWRKCNNNVICYLSTHISSSYKPDIAFIQFAVISYERNGVLCMFDSYVASVLDYQFLRVFYFWADVILDMSQLGKSWRWAIASLWPYRKIHQSLRSHSLTVWYNQRTRVVFVSGLWIFRLLLL